MTQPGRLTGVFAVTLPERSSEEVRARAATLMSVVGGRHINPSDVVENAYSSTSSLRRFNGPGFFAEWEPDTDYLEAFSNDPRTSDDGNETHIGEAEAFRRFRCALVQLERRSLVAPETVPAEGASLSRLMSFFP
jgi:hypothetical protein